MQRSSRLLWRQDTAMRRLLLQMVCERWRRWLVQRGLSTQRRKDAVSTTNCRFSQQHARINGWGLTRRCLGPPRPTPHATACPPLIRVRGDHGIDRNKN
jgi:hypothetical protein